MSDAEIIEICRQAIIVMLKLMGPILLAGLVVGIIVSLFQTVTQIQETALNFIPKLLVLFGLTIFLSPFMLSTLVGFTHMIGDKIVEIGQNDSSSH